MSKRLDLFLVEKKLVETRSKAQDLIKRGFVEVNGQIVKKSSAKITDSDEVKITTKEIYVSRAAEKLLKAIVEFNIDLNGKTCLDIGSSTGGFTEIMLKHGAKKIFAVDVGSNQLHKKLRDNKKIVLYEQTDARNLTNEQIFEKIDFFASDVSFISITKILPSIKKFLTDDATGVVLIKPQFELSPEEVGKGVVKDSQLHQKAIRKVIETIAKNGFYTTNLIKSPITGGDGNIEFLIKIETNQRKQQSYKSVYFE